MIDRSDRSLVEGLIADAAMAAAFLTRVPAEWLGIDPTVRPNFSRAARAFPIVGLIVGIASGIILLLAHALRLPPLVAASLAIGASIVLTGALHEDGLADTADGFGGGKTAVAKLEIMRDSRIGTFGAITLVLSLLLRVGLVAGLLSNGAWHAALALVGAEAVGRAAMVHMWASLPSARANGLTETTGRPGNDTAWAAAVVALAIGLVAGLLGAGPMAAIIACLAALLATYGMERFCKSMIGGRTGDTLGATEQAASIAFMLALVAFS